MDTTHTTETAAPVAARLYNARLYLRRTRRNMLRANAERDAVAEGTREHDRRRVVAEVMFTTYLRARSEFFAAGGIL